MIQVFSRHCFFSDASSHKQRFDGFSREGCYRNLLDTIGNAKLTFFLDTAKGQDHFLSNEKTHPVIRISAGTEASSFIQLLDHVEALKLAPDTILYFVEDDYLHRVGWVDVLLEAMRLPGIDYVTLYDHRDKYFQYPNLKSKIFITPSCHWRTTPSTTQTFAVRAETLLEDLTIHREFSTNVKITKDHEKFLTLGTLGRTLVSAMPGWSTHAEPAFASPCVDWDAILTRSSYGAC